MGATTTGGEQGAARHGTGVRMRRIAGASLIGTTIEWYDFFLYGAMAALVFNQIFFPHLDPTAGTLAAFATFVAGFLARPVGSLLMRRFGRRAGRKRALVTSLTLMSLATIAIGLVPNYDRIGVAAPVALVTLRLVQGFALGGEWSAAATLTIEHAPKQRRGWWAAWGQYGALVGILLSSGTMLALSTTLTDRQFLTWGWRVPFLGAGLLLIIGLVIRLRIAGSPAVRAREEQDEDAGVRVLGSVPRHSWTFLRVTGMHLVVTTLAVTTSTFVLFYGVTRAGYTRTEMLQIVCIATAITMVLAPWIGHLCDVVGRRVLYVLGAAAAMAGAFPAFILLDLGRLDAGVGALLCLVLPTAILYQTQGAYFPELFPARHRGTATGLGVQVATVAVGAPAPFIAQALLESSNDRVWWVSAYLCGVAFVSMLFALGTHDKRPARAAAVERRPHKLHADRPAAHAAGDPYPDPWANPLLTAAVVRATAAAEAVAAEVPKPIPAKPAPVPAPTLAKPAVLPTPAKHAPVAKALHAKPTAAPTAPAAQTAPAAPAAAKQEPVPTPTRAKPTLTQTPITRPSPANPTPVPTATAPAPPAAPVATPQPAKPTAKPVVVPTVVPAVARTAARPTPITKPLPAAPTPVPRPEPVPTTAAQTPLAKAPAAKPQVVPPVPPAVRQEPVAKPMLPATPDLRPTPPTPTPPPAVRPVPAASGSRRPSAATASTEELVASWDLLSPTPPVRPADPADDRASRWEAAKSAARSSAPAGPGPVGEDVAPVQATDPAPAESTAPRSRRAHAGGEAAYIRPADLTTRRPTHAAVTAAPAPVPTGEPAPAAPVPPPAADSPAPAKLTPTGPPAPTEERPPTLWERVAQTMGGTDGASQPSRAPAPTEERPPTLWERVALAMDGTDAAARAQPGAPVEHVGPGALPAENPLLEQRRPAGSQQDEQEHRLRERRRAVRQILQREKRPAAADEGTTTPPKSANGASAIVP